MLTFTWSVVHLHLNWRGGMRTRRDVGRGRASLPILPFLPEVRGCDTWMGPFGGDQAPTVVYVPVQRTGPAAAAVTVTSQPEGVRLPGVTVRPAPTLALAMAV